MHVNAQPMHDTHAHAQAHTLYTMQRHTQSYTYCQSTWGTLHTVKIIHDIRVNIRLQLQQTTDLGVHRDKVHIRETEHFLRSQPTESTEVQKNATSNAVPGVQGRRCVWAQHLPWCTWARYEVQSSLDCHSPHGKQLDEEKERERGRKSMVESH